VLAGRACRVAVGAGIHGVQDLNGGFRVLLGLALHLGGAAVPPLLEGLTGCEGVAADDGVHHAARVLGQGDLAHGPGVEAHHAIRVGLNVHDGGAEQAQVEIQLVHAGLETGGLGVEDLEQALPRIGQEGAHGLVIRSAARETQVEPGQRRVGQQPAQGRGQEFQAVGRGGVEYGAVVSLAGDCAVAQSWGLARHDLRGQLLPER